jgi:hypothetical protein
MNPFIIAVDNDPHCLREGAFDASPLLVLVLKGLGCLALPGQLQDLELVLGVKNQLATGGFHSWCSGRVGHMHDR